ncbi:hypothetical protein CSA56_10045 [candidate division KSB3 bacterium]|uniref:Uncharacterized protein n=1 Tax=candidate division KSB3 bacterium TaxID=2044937 RepID=A0A2G6KDT4_9BACT|nr:MAG: hypothetical protein CSA56_10045 [candidate division KSB3 bacterium]
MDEGCKAAFATGQNPINLSRFRREVIAGLHSCLLCNIPVSMQYDALATEVRTVSKARWRMSYDYKK